MLGIERPDVRQIGILSFATIVHNTYSAKQLTDSALDKYVREFFNEFLGKIPSLAFIFVNENIPPFP